MKENWDEALKHVLRYEGGYVNHPSDPGGMTNLGVTKRVWEEWIGRPATEQDMRSLTPELVSPLYKKRYWDAVRGDDLPSGVDLCVFDCAVNAGPGRASKFLQQVVGVTVDGQIGPKTIAAVTSKPADTVIEAFCDLREAHFKSLSTFPTFGKGWMRRLNSVESECKGMCDA
jgi:lysozyme family protein